jgi:hypothetical protein
MKHKVPTFAASLEATQFALEQSVKRVGALEKQNDGLAKLNKQLEIRVNETDLKLSRFAERFLERLGRIELAMTEGDAE